MKKITSYAVFLGLLVLLGCRDDSLNPLPGWEPGVHGFGVFADIAEPKDGSGSRPNAVANAVNFPVANQGAAKENFRLRWVSLDNKLTVNKMEVYVNMLESYNDPDGNPKTASLGAKLIKTISPAPGNRTWSDFSISPDDIYTLYKDATVKYDGTNAVKVFENPARPRSATQRLLGAGKVNGLNVNADQFVLTWYLYTTDGLVFKVWNSDSICGDPTPYSQAAANCSLNWTVK
ncbi:MAG: hypothetical protein INR73_28560 [Williamsia sp.]|nr:hypothetical protein [Williamsia sp.]